MRLQTKPKLWNFVQKWWFDRKTDYQIGARFDVDMVSWVPCVYRDGKWLELRPFPVADVKLLTVSSALKSAYKSVVVYDYLQVYCRVR